MTGRLNRPFLQTRMEMKLQLGKKQLSLILSQERGCLAFCGRRSDLVSVCAETVMKWPCFVSSHHRL